ncbi:vomeronasal type-1 receptor 1 [Camelus ferus]|uniref:Vomeronasal type-1 receptor n=1 Tax=Camelus ferus TaxID=419612 RepID=A0A8B8TGG8_CAMFR|nr:vomeronasal type-1 receptor 1 [Camelus ferus]XP_032341338.1 vomeronasal type-1 receptor 1 [Camelus ferus]XP_032341339.1 vomeronasal type-1 receptor 1 [Camelus ferus]XP_032341340.1 vomeronasal type-1 receptor 1 [Camelus ferus]XP_032341341.1 vomeronasal type-1 receptor 1 [Camelus ferus]
MRVSTHATPSLVSPATEDPAVRLATSSPPGRHSLRPTDPVLTQLVSASSVALFSKGAPQTLAAFGWTYFPDDPGCKLVFCLHGVAAGVSFSTVCLFNGFQAIKLKPSIWRWMELKLRSLKLIVFCCSLCWIVHIVINSCLPLIIKGPLQWKNLSMKRNYGYCSWHLEEGFVGLLLAVLCFSPDTMSLGFSIWASGNIVLILYMHKRRVEHLCSHRLPPRPSHEARATRILLVLVSSFFAFCLLYIVLTIWMTLVANRSQWMVNVSVLVAMCFPTFSPFVLIISDTRVSRFCFACRARKTLSPRPVVVGWVWAAVFTYPFQHLWTFGGLLKFKNG